MGRKGILTAKDSIRIPPSNLGAEKALLRNEILFESIIPEVAEILDPEDFYSDIHQSIQKTLLKMRSDGLPISYGTLADSLQSGKLWSDAGETVTQFIHQLEYDSPEWLGNARYAIAEAKMIAECARRRRAINAARTLEDAAWDQSKDMDEVGIEFAKSSETISADYRNKSPWRSLKEFEIEAAIEFGHGRKPTRFIGITEIDDAIGGVANGENVVIGGETSHGKTMTVLQWLDMASRQGVPSLLISLEMKGKGLAARRLSGATNLPEDLWQSENYKLIEDVEERYHRKSSIIIAENCGHISEVERAIERAVREFGVGIVALDYLQLVKGDGYNREQQVADVSRRWKQALLKFDVIGLMLAQLNRESAKLNRLPKLSDLRESGAIEQDADIVLFPYWAAKNDKGADVHLYQIGIAKTRQRGTKTPVVAMRIDPVKQWLFPLDPEAHQRAMDWNN